MDIQEALERGRAFAQTAQDERFAGFAEDEIAKAFSLYYALYEEVEAASAEGKEPPGLDTVKQIKAAIGIVAGEKRVNEIAQIISDIAMSMTEQEATNDK